MSYKHFLWGMRFLAVGSLLGVAGVVLFASPYQNQETGRLITTNVIALETGLFLSFFAGFSLLLFWVRRWKRQDLRKKELDFLAKISARQGFLLSMLMIALLVMQSFRILTWWDGLLAVGAVIMIELYFLMR
ncbi:MAG: hypothetical protein R6V40_02540 [Candidatus Moraniibacteriota bacterium]